MKTLEESLQQKTETTELKDLQKHIEEIENKISKTHENSQQGVL